MLQPRFLILKVLPERRLPITSFLKVSALALQIVSSLRTSTTIPFPGMCVLAHLYGLSHTAFYTLRCDPLEHLFTVVFRSRHLGPVLASRCSLRIKLLSLSHFSNSIFTKQKVQLCKPHFLSHDVETAARSVCMGLRLNSNLCVAEEAPQPRFGHFSTPLTTQRLLAV